MADTALRTADSGYLTRRLVDVSQDVIIREHDCHCSDGIEISDIKDGNNIIEPLRERLTGRFLLDSLYNGQTNELIMSNDHMLSDADAQIVADYVNANTGKIKIRSLLTCEAEHGVCIKCYGSNLATADPVTVGEAVGIIVSK